jgi:hypothetical protein
MITNLIPRGKNLEVLVDTHQDTRLQENEAVEACLLSGNIRGGLEWMNYKRR